MFLNLIDHRVVHIQIFSGSMNPQMTEENRNHWETLIGYKKFKVSSQPTIRHFLHWCSWCCRPVHTIIDCKIQLLHIFLKTFQYTLPLYKEHVDLPPFFFLLQKLTSRVHPTLHFIMRHIQPIHHHPLLLFFEILKGTSTCMYSRMHITVSHTYHSNNIFLLISNRNYSKTRL